MSSSRGKQIFGSNCVGCHGLDGTGSQRAPNIVSNPQVQKLSAEEMFRIVSDGVPGTGMPSFKSLGPPAIRSTVAYVRSLQGKNSVATLPGNPKQGKTLFFGAAECGNCHMAGGRGGFGGRGGGGPPGGGGAARGGGRRGRGGMGQGFLSQLELLDVGFTLEKLGAGEAIDGRPTQHYRVTTEPFISCPRRN